MWKFETKKESFFVKKDNDGFIFELENSKDPAQNVKEHYTDAPEIVNFLPVETWSLYSKFLKKLGY